jgi:hypothetical protein
LNVLGLAASSERRRSFRGGNLPAVVRALSMNKFSSMPV